jgi:pyocin large subunit-like protein
MGIFDSIKEKLGFGDDDNAIQAVDNAADITTEEVQSEEAAPTADVVAQAMPSVDVIGKLEELAASNSNLNWKTSIVDLMKLLGIDSSYAHRKELASEVGIDGYEGTAEQNIALHKAVLKKLAENGGNIPSSLLA